MPSTVKVTAAVAQPGWLTTMRVAPPRSAAAPPPMVLASASTEVAAAAALLIHSGAPVSVAVPVAAASGLRSGQDAVSSIVRRCDGLSGGKRNSVSELANRQRLAVGGGKCANLARARRPSYGVGVAGAAVCAAAGVVGQGTTAILVIQLSPSVPFSTRFGPKSLSHSDTICSGH